MSVFAQALQSWRRQLKLQLTSVLVMGLCFTTILVVSLISKNIEKGFSSWGNKVEMSVYMSEESGLEQRSKVESALRNMKEIRSYNFLDSKKAQKEFMDQFSGLVPELKELKDVNPFLESFELELSEIPASMFSVNFVEDIAKRIHDLDGVEEVSYGRYWFESYMGFMRGLKASTFLIAMILSFASLMIVGNSIRALVDQRRKEVEILELIGATPQYIRVPFVLSGAITGFLASAFSIGLGFLLYGLVISKFMNAVKILGISDKLSFFNPLELLAIIVSGVLIGAIGSYLCIKNINNGWSAVQTKA
ncbi:MAG: permease-like cell division protein FtsX [Bdellovibrionota bacterium]|nr:permease-like cell division protein FtsX [Bdellovibrionota bacterium]